MDIPIDYIIANSSTKTDFSKSTISNFKRSEVLTQLKKSLKNSNIPNAIMWMTELHCSGHINQIINELISFYSININITNPNLPYYFYQRYKSYINITKNYKKVHLLETRNNQEIRNILADLTYCITYSNKNTYISHIKKPKQEDYIKTNIQARLISHNLKLISNIISNKCPSEIQLGINEIANHLHNINAPLEEPYFWFEWLLKLSKYNHKNKIEFMKENEWYLLIWKIIYNEAELRNHNRILIQIKSLFELYKIVTKSKRKDIIFCAIIFLKKNIDWSIPIFRSYSLRIQTIGNINQMYNYIGRKLNNMELNKYNDIKNKSLNDNNKIKQEHQQYMDKLKIKRKLKYINYIPLKKSFEPEYVVSNKDYKNIII